MFFPGNIYPEYLNKYAGEDSHDKPYAKSYAEVIRSQMTWQLSNKGRVSPATWTKDFLYQGAQKKMGQQLSFDEWIICQDYFIGTIPAEYRSMCDQNYPADCLDETKGLHATDQCPPPALWKKDNMWSPRRGHQALVHRTFGEGGEWGVGKLYVLGGRAREFARVDDERMVGGVVGSKVATDLEAQFPLSTDPCATKITQLTVWTRLRVSTRPTSAHRLHFGKRTTCGAQGGATKHSFTGRLERAESGASGSSTFWGGELESLRELTTSVWLEGW